MVDAGEAQGPGNGADDRPTSGPSATGPSADAALQALPPDALAAARRDIALLLAAGGA